MALGRGLSALLGDVPASQSQPSPAGEQPSTVPLAALDRNPGQPRRHFDDDALAELSASIRERGLLQPILVRPKADGRYEIIAGERRWRAAQLAELHDVPVIVRHFDDAETFEIALIENLQRVDLNPIEEAEGYAKLVADYGHSHAELGQVVNKSRSHVTNLVRLLDLPQPVRAMLLGGQLTMGHARALITAPDPEKLAREVVGRGLSVRETERLARGEKADGGARAARQALPIDADVAALERQLSDALGLKVQIAHSGAAGKISVAYGSLDQLDLLCQRLSGEPI
jgi:ParB family transcriptional regulator, chromosome partitioning protein